MLDNKLNNTFKILFKRNANIRNPEDVNLINSLFFVTQYNGVNLGIYEEYSYTHYGKNVFSSELTHDMIYFDHKAFSNEPMTLYEKKAINALNESLENYSTDNFSKEMVLYGMANYIYFKEILINQQNLQKTFEENSDKKIARHFYKISNAFENYIQSSLSEDKDEHD